MKNVTLRASIQDGGIDRYASLPRTTKKNNNQFKNKK